MPHKSGKQTFSISLNELISIISPLYVGTFIDCTFGQADIRKIHRIQKK